MNFYLLQDLSTQKVVLRRRLRDLICLLVFIFILDRLTDICLLSGLEQYYGLSQPAELLLVGYSHIVLGVDKVKLEETIGVPVAKYARAGATLRDRDIMVKHYLSRNPGVIRTVVYGVDAHIFNSEGLSSNSYRLFYPYMGDPIIDKFLQDAVSEKSEYVLRKIIRTTRYDDVTLGLSIRGHLGDWRNYKRGTVNIERLQKEVREGGYREIEFEASQLEIFRQTVRHLVNEGVVVVLAYIPTLDLLNAIEPASYARAVSIFESMSAEHDSVYFVNLNPLFSHQHDYFRDPVHMNSKGQRAVTIELGRQIEKIR